MRSSACARASKRASCNRAPASEASATCSTRTSSASPATSSSRGRCASPSTAAMASPACWRRGGRPLIWKTGHSLIKAKLKETGALLAGEMSGHTFFKERWYGFDDALYGGARLLEVLSRERDPSALLKSLPNAPSTPELHWQLEEGEPHALVEKLQATKPFPGAERVLTIDGVRVEYADGFGLARASNTTPVVVIRFEADNNAALERIKQQFRAALQPLKPDAPLPY